MIVAGSKWHLRSGGPFLTAMSASKIKGTIVVRVEWEDDNGDIQETSFWLSLLDKCDGESCGYCAARLK